MHNLPDTLSKTDKTILYSIFGSIPAGMFLFLIYWSIWGPSSRQIMIEKDLAENVNGIVDTVYNDAPNHNVRTAILKNNSVYLILPEWESKIEKGDSLYKKKGTFLLEVYKKGGQKIILDYKPTLPGK